MKRPDFIIGGATRSGIKAMMHILDHHPQIFIPARKEHQFFHQDNILSPELESVAPNFSDAVHISNALHLPEGRSLHGEQEFSAQRAHRGCPHAKVIFTLRNPVERAYAQYLHALSNKKERAKTFERAIEAELSGIRTPQNGPCWIYKNQYQTHIEDWLQYYPRKKICIMIYEEWTDPNTRALHLLERFLGLKDGSLHLEEKLVAYLRDTVAERKAPPLSDYTREQLEDIFAVDKVFIENFLGRKIPAWSERI